MKQVDQKMQPAAWEICFAYGLCNEQFRISGRKQQPFYYLVGKSGDLTYGSYLFRGFWELS